MAIVEHPGVHVKAEVLPDGISITEAAQLLDVGRVALSNFLNGKAALSHDMALRLEKTFGANRTELLAKQVAFEQATRRGRHDVVVRAFVPQFLVIKARHIDDWADTNLDARALLPVLLRKLVFSSGADLERVDFPGYDNSQRKGNDGFVESKSATPWVPVGKSYWEFGTDAKIKNKADGDYAARLKSVSPELRAESTFVFVTPRNWVAKAQWEKQKSETGDWKSVRVFEGMSAV